MSCSEIKKCSISLVFGLKLKNKGTLFSLTLKENKVLLSFQFEVKSLRYGYFLNLKKDGMLRN